MAEFIQVAIEDKVAILKLNRAPVNALGLVFLKEIEETICSLEDNPEVKAIVMASAIPNVFIAGVDLKEMAKLQTVDEIVGVIQKGQSVFNRIERCQKPIIAAVHGACVGGGMELVMACHIRIASDRTRFAQPEITLGIIPGFGGSQRLPRIVGASRAAELILTGDLITPKDAEAMGLINHVVSDGALIKTAKEIGKKIARHGLPAIRASMRAIGRGLDKPLSEALKIEEEEFRSIAGTADMREGIQAFLEKRQPRFADR